jgi:hypothetical protein
MQSSSREKFRKFMASLGMISKQIIDNVLSLKLPCRFPGQEHVAGNSKIPSVMYYDRRGKMQAAGAEAESASVLSQAEDESWVKAELYVLSLSAKESK